MSRKIHDPISVVSRLPGVRIAVVLLYIIQQVVKSETKKLEKKLTRYNVPPVGHMEECKREGRCRIMYSQLNNASISTARHVKMDRVHNLNEKYQVDVSLFAKVGVNWTAGADSNFAS